MTDFTDIIPADLLPEEVREYDKLFGEGTFGRAMASIPCDVGEEQIYVAHIADAAIAAALELAASLMVCATCEHWLLTSETCKIDGGIKCDTKPCKFTPSSWQHYRAGEA